MSAAAGCTSGCTPVAIAPATPGWRSPSRGAHSAARRRCDRGLYAAVLFPDRPRECDPRPHLPRRRTLRPRIRQTGACRADRAIKTATRSAWPGTTNMWPNCVNRQTDRERARWARPDIGSTFARPGHVGVAFAAELRSIDNLQLGAVVLGPYQGEGGGRSRCRCSIAPGQPGEYWMPPYFTTWRGSSLVLTDADLTRLHRRADLGLEDGNQRLRLGNDAVFEPSTTRRCRCATGTTTSSGCDSRTCRRGFPGAWRCRTTGRDPNTHHVVPVDFRRRKRPGPVEIEQIPTRPIQLPVSRAAVRAPGDPVHRCAHTFAELEDALDGDAGGRPLALPDPDVTAAANRGGRAQPRRRSRRMGSALRDRRTRPRTRGR